MAKQTTDRISEIAAMALRTGKATMQQIKALAASALGQDETKGKRAVKPKGAVKARKPAAAARKAGKPRKAAKPAKAARAKK